MAAERIILRNQTSSIQYFSYTKYVDLTEQIGISLNPGQEKMIWAILNTLSFNSVTSPITIVQRIPWPPSPTTPVSTPPDTCAINWSNECTGGTLTPIGILNDKPYFVFDGGDPIGINTKIYWDNVNMWWAINTGASGMDPTHVDVAKLVADTPYPVSSIINWEYITGANCFVSSGGGGIVFFDAGFVDPTCVGCPTLCPSIFPWQPYNDNCCYWVETQPVTPPSVSQYTAQIAQSVVYSSLGTRIYDYGFPIAGNGTILTTLTTSNIWQSTSSSDGPMNRCSIWTTEPNYTPYNEWLGFSTCISVTGGTYYFGVAADNNFRAVINGIEILNTRNGVYDNSVIAFKYWHIYPVELTDGDNILEIFGLNRGSIAGFGCTIYNNTYNELVNATSLGDLNEVFTTSGATEFQIVQNTLNQYLPTGYSCPQGFRYGCSGCTRYNYCCW